MPSVASPETVHPGQSPWPAIVDAPSAPAELSLLDTSARLVTGSMLPAIVQDMVCAGRPWVAVLY